jgi:hypothetical protein
MEETGKTTDLSQVTVKLYHIMLYCMVKELPRGAQVEMDGVLVKEADPE